MLKIIFGKRGQPISDFESLAFVDNIIDNYTGEDTEVFICNEAVLNMFELRIFEDKIDISEVEFYVEEEKLNHDKYVGVDEWKTYRGEYLFFADVTDRILKLGYQKMLADRGRE